MANKKRPDTNGSQFYITYAPQKSLDNQNTVFGQYLSSINHCFSVIDGFDVLDKIERLEVDKKTYRPLTEVKILKTGITLFYLM